MAPLTQDGGPQVALACGFHLSDGGPCPGLFSGTLAGLASSGLAQLASKPPHTVDEPSFEIRIGDKGRAALGRVAKKGERWQVEPISEEQFLITRMVVAMPKLPVARMVRRRGRRMLTHDRSVTLEDTQRALENFP